MIVFSKTGVVMKTGLESKSVFPKDWEVGIETRNRRNRPS